MCFILHHKFMNPLYTEKDIICYKSSEISERFRKTFKSEWKVFKYELGKLYKTKQPLRKECPPSLYYGIAKHIIEKGFHSFIEIIRFRSDGVRFVECVIPKGSVYYKNPDRNEYVSNQIIIKRYLSKKETFKLMYTA